MGYGFKGQVQRAILCQRNEENMSLEKVIHEIKREIERLTEVLGLLAGVGGRKRKRARRKISAAGRKKISQAQKKRWAKVKAGRK
jgi:ferritin-like metal-binding protein YciE